jgi:hypothetical protein
MQQIARAAPGQDYAANRASDPALLAFDMVQGGP